MIELRDSIHSFLSPLDWPDIDKAKPQHVEEWACHMRALAEDAALMEFRIGDRIRYGWDMSDPDQAAAFGRVRTWLRRARKESRQLSL